MYRTAIAYETFVKLLDFAEPAEQAVLRLTYDAEYFGASCNSSSSSAVRNFDREDARQFGPIDPQATVDVLIELFKKLGLLIPVKVVGDIVTHRIYLEAHRRLMNLTSDQAARYEPWTSRLKRFLEAKL